MNPSRRVLVPAAIALAALFGVGSAQAHNWGCWRQPNRTVYSYVTAALSTQANAAISEWDSKTILSLPRTSYHSEIHVYDGYYGNTGWAGIAQIISYSGCNILHGHARVNRSYSYTSNGYRGIFCQEVGHLFGLDHSNDGGCMGGGYFYSINTYYNVVSHNVNDIYNKYVNSPAATSEQLASASPDFSDVAGMASGKQYAVAFWHERPNTLEEAMARSEAVVVGRILRIQPGADIIVPVEGHEDGVDRIPTQRVLVAVEEVLGGRMEGKVFELFRTGNDDWILEEDPAYVEGERYVLFLTSRERGTYRLIAPEGRLKITELGLQPVSEREFMGELRGADVSTLSRDIQRVTPMLQNEPQAPRLQLRRNSANPFRTSTSLSYSLPEPTQVQLRVLDAQGRVVRELVDAFQEGPRWYTVQWDGTDQLGQSVPSGVYFLRLQTPRESQSLQVIRMR